MNNTNLLVLAKEFKKLKDQTLKILEMPIGPQGPQGVKGDKGDKGDPGIQGFSGKDGKDGKNGKDGVNGKDGKDGAGGLDGKDGVSVIDAKVDFDGSLTLYLSDGTEIDAGKATAEQVENIYSVLKNGAASLDELLPPQAGNAGKFLTTNGSTPSWAEAGSVLPTLTAGSIAFSNGTTFTQDNDNLFWDNTNKRFGLGTKQPLRALHVVGAAPTLTSISAYNGAIIENNDNVQLVLATQSNRTSIISFGHQGNTYRGAIEYRNTTDTLALRVNNADRILVTGTGTGFGIANPQAQVHISGTSGARACEVDNTHTTTGSSSAMRVRQRGQNNTITSSTGFTMQSEVFGTAVNTTVTGVVGGEYLNLFRADSRNVTVGTSVGVHLRAPSITELNGGIASITNSIGALINNQGHAKITNSYGIKIDAQSGSSANSYAIFSEGGKSYHKGNFGIDELNPTSKLHVTGLPVYADNATALAGGMTAGAFYRTASGELRVTI